jgi:hypothetical protein
MRKEERLRYAIQEVDLYKFTRGGILLWLRGEWRTGLLRLMRCMTLGKGMT